MVAAEITPTVVQKTYLVSTKITGTPVRLVKYLLKTTKVTTDDWILLETAIGTTVNSIIGATGIVIDSSDDMAAETLTYTDADDKLILAGGTTGTSYITIIMEEA